ncbi:MAG: ornithine cyclodeaminase family protein, partial [Bacteroidota bacterium]
MRYFSAEEIQKHLRFPDLVNALREGFRSNILMPPRMHMDYANPKDQNQNTLLLMPSVQIGAFVGVKIVNVSPKNAQRNLPAVQGMYYLLDAVSGEPKAIFEGQSLTNWRTAAASALAASYLANQAASTLLMIGTGGLAPFVIKAHASQRPIQKLMIYGRTPAKAQSLAEAMKSEFSNVEVLAQLDERLAEADIISAATLSSEALILGKYLRPGQHIDLIGSFRPNMREADNEVIQQARVFVDSRGMARSPDSRGAISRLS